MKIYAFADEASPQVEGQIAAMKRNGLDGLEIRGVDGEGIAEITISKAREVKKKLQDAGLGVWSIGSPIGKISILEDFARHLSLFRHVIDLAQVLEAENIRLFSFYMPAGEDPALYRNQVLDQMHGFAEAARGSGVTLCHENEKGIYGDVAARCLDIAREIPEIRAIFDPANYIQCGQETLSAWAAMKPYVRYLHIKDALPGGQVVPAGCGNGHVAEILKDYRASGGSAITIEPHLTVFSGFEKLENGPATPGKYEYPSNDAAFDAACNAAKALLKDA